jgi:hypothetical protein
MTRVEARKVVKTKAPNQYHGTSLTLLSLLVDSCFGPEGPRPMNIKDSTMMGWIRVGSRQLSNILNRFAEDGVCTFTRKGNKVTVFMDLSPLVSLPERPTTKEAKADRAKTAREVYAAKRAEAALGAELGKLIVTNKARFFENMLHPTLAARGVAAGATL